VESRGGLPAARSPTRSATTHPVHQRGKSVAPRAGDPPGAWLDDGGSRRPVPMHPVTRRREGSGGPSPAPAGPVEPGWRARSLCYTPRALTGQP
jgi:hypothetical protein